MILTLRQVTLAAAVALSVSIPSALSAAAAATPKALPAWASAPNATQRQVQHVGTWRFHVLKRLRTKATADADEVQQVGGAVVEDETWIELADAAPGLTALRDRIMRMRRDGEALAYAYDRSFEDASSGASIEIAQEVVAASPDLVAIRLVAIRYGGGAHGEWHSLNLNWSTRRGRALDAGDLVADMHDPALVRVLNTAFSGAEDGCPEHPLGFDLSRATISAVGLRFEYDSYELGSYTCGGHSVLTWAALRPFLRADLPLDPRALIDAVQLRWRPE